LDSLNVASVFVRNDLDVALNVSTKSSNCYKVKHTSLTTAHIFLYMYM
jgi:hypothetical protein